MDHILLVEDQEETRLWLASLIDQAFPQSTIHHASNLKEARANVSAVQLDLAIVDIGLPDGSGIDLVSELAVGQPGTMRIVSTIFSDDEHIFSALRAGAQGYLLKDQGDDELLLMLRSVLSGQPPLSPEVARRVLTHFHAPVEEEPSQEKLTDREQEVLSLIAKGYTTRRVAELLDITRNTAAGYVKNVYTKLNVHSRAEATLAATRQGLVRPEAI